MENTKPFGAAAVRGSAGDEVRGRKRARRGEAMLGTSSHSWVRM